MRFLKPYLGEFQFPLPDRGNRGTTGNSGDMGNSYIPKTALT